MKQPMEKEKIHYTTRKNTDDSFGDDAVEMTDIDERVAPVSFANNNQIRGHTHPVSMMGSQLHTRNTDVLQTTVPKAPSMIQGMTDKQSINSKLSHSRISNMSQMHGRNMSLGSTQMHQSKFANQ